MLHYLQTRVLHILHTSDSIDYKTAQIDWILSQGLAQLVNTYIPGLGRTLFQYCVATLSDQELSIIEKMLEYADLSMRDGSGLSVFDSLVPVEWSKQRMFLRLLEEVDDPARTCLILQAAIKAGSLQEAALLERLRLAYWELQGKSGVRYEQV